MFVVGTPITITASISTTPNTYIVSDFDIRVMLPNKTVTYINAVTTISYTAPTVTTTGSISFSYTPNSAGLHEIVISTGTADNHIVRSKTLLNVIGVSTTKLFNIKL
jgi:S-ribosylhomocysteine lyase LuxS involved in autoinducer biosynthesis